MALTSGVGMFAARFGSLSCCTSHLSPNGAPRARRFSGLSQRLGMSRKHKRQSAKFPR
jgi:hypothetical protein